MELSQWPYTVGGGGVPLPGPPPPQTKVTIVGKNEIYNWENLIGPFLVHKLLGPRPPPSPPLLIFPWEQGAVVTKTVAAVIGVGGMRLECNQQSLLGATSPSRLGS